MTDRHNCIICACQVFHLALARNLERPALAGANLGSMCASYIVL